MKLHWSPRSPFVRKVMIAAHELGLVERIELVRSVADMKRPNTAIMADNPLSKIPTMVLGDGEPIFDSVVICEYLDDLAGGGRLFPARGTDRWRALTWHALATGLLDVLILWRNEREKKPEERQTPEWLSAFATKVDASLDRLESLVPHLDEVRFGIGHIAVGCALGYLDFRFTGLDWRATRPALAAWQTRFKTRPSAIATEVRDD
jgi:glutathione S-transferase